MGCRKADSRVVSGTPDYLLVGTMAKRKSRLTWLVHLPREPGHGTVARAKNGPALAGYGAQRMNRALVSNVAALPPRSLRPLTYDRGKELSGHAAFTDQTGAGLYFADSHSPWQRPLNGNSGGLLRQYFPQGTDLSRWAPEHLDSVTHALNTRPRKCLGWITPAAVLAEEQQSPEDIGVATTA